MTPTEFAQFKYRHTDAVARTPARLVVVGISLGLAIILLALREVPLPIALFAFLVPAVAWWSAGRFLLLGPRYLLCGKAIIYYANVQRLTLARGSGTLRVQSKSGQTFTLEREKFPTNARKADKIQKNKTAKFNKVADKIIEKVRKTAPGAELVGV